MGRFLFQYKDKQAGIALIEALMAMFMFSLGVLALVGVQAVMTKNVTHAKLRSEASLLANQIIGQMWLDQANLANYVVEEGECSGAGDIDACTTWLTAVGQMLPAGGAEITVNGRVVTVALNWQMPGDGEVPGKYEIDAVITN
jgi:type IV pilus assembly protein PilV